jgi:hypothetical protein
MHVPGGGRYGNACGGRLWITDCMCTGATFSNVMPGSRPSSTSTKTSKNESAGKSVPASFAVTPPSVRRSGSSRIVSGGPPMLVSVICTISVSMWGNPAGSSCGGPRCTSVGPATTVSSRSTSVAHPATGVMNTCARESK